METDLWQDIRNGSTVAMKTLYQDCYQELYAYGFRMLPDKDRIQDCLHELFTDIWLKRETIGHVEYVRTYLKTCIKNKLLKEITQSKKISSIDAEPSAQELQEFSYEQLLIESQFVKEQKHKIWMTIGKLTTNQREIIKMKFYDGLSYEAISIQLKLKPRTVYNHVYAAICTLRAELK